MKLDELLKRKNNNLDIFRLLAASMVIYGHAYMVVPHAGEQDVVHFLLGFEYSGSLAVKIFFFLSGLVVTNSLLTKQNALQFSIARFFRIWPGLLLVTCISAFLLGPMVTSLSVSEYFSTGQAFSYVINNVFMYTEYKLPGVFLDNHYREVVNGPLWTIPIEVGSYLALLACFLMGSFQRRWLALLVLFILVADGLSGNQLLFTWRTLNPEWDLLGPCFAIGAVFALYKEDIEVGPMALGWILFYFLFSPSTYSIYLFYMALFSSILYLSSLPVLQKLKTPADISYGVYLWGLPVQQTLQYAMPGHSILFNQVISIILAMMLGFASWHLVEKRGIAAGQRAIRRFS